MIDLEKVNGDWEFDPTHTRIGFSAKHAMVTTVRGAFNEITGHLHVDTENPDQSWAKVVMKVGSVDTRVQQRDDHLRSADFFDAEKWPEITFVSTHIEEVDDRAFSVTGDLTIRDVTKQVMIPLALIGLETGAYGELRAGFEGTRRLNRRDFGLVWNTPLDSGGVLVSEKITLEFEISAVKVEASDEDAAEQDESGEEKPAEDAAEGEGEDTTEDSDES
ncbi:polyisoprenoid-binding protein [Microbacterium bovistercoris]|uniref:Polyisoprenoid-binding protein n=1 Tax=Microbacterium bovistercoris TaxID=2293570 RepID=A0A371NTB4_9MICO|nr:YceI family protein [Microbacterium bovistercoris]REJ05430.1 polyisoprenoid-binding protein [Microbacterium bovistercoris]